MSYHTAITNPRTPFHISKLWDKMELPSQVRYLQNYIKLLNNFNFNARYNSRKITEKRKIVIEITTKEQHLEKLISMAAFLKIPI